MTKRNIKSKSELQSAKSLTSTEFSKELGLKTKRLKKQKLIRKNQIGAISPPGLFLCENFSVLMIKTLFYATGPKKEL